MVSKADHELFQRAADSNTPGALRDSLWQFLKRGALRALIDGCHRDHSQMVDLADRSYRHDNGFWKLVLLETESYQLRAHLWLEDHAGSRGEPNIHNHRWNFGSLLLHGGYLQERFDVCQGDDESISVTRWSYRPRADGIGGFVAEREHAQLRKLSETQYRTGDGNLLAARELHRVTAGEGTTISVILTGPSIHADTDVYTQSRLAHLPESVVRKLNVKEVERAMAELDGALGDYEGQHG